MLMRASARASGPPGQAWGPRPKARCSLAFSRSMWNSAGSSKRRGSRPAAPLTTITVVPAGISTPPTVAARAGKPEVALDRTLDPQDSSTKPGMRSRSSRSSSWSSGRSPISWNAAARRRTVVSWPAENTLAATRTTSITSGVDPSGKVAVASPVSTSLRGARRRSST